MQGSFTHSGQLKNQNSLSLRSEKIFSFNNFKKSFWITCISIIKVPSRRNQTQYLLLRKRWQGLPWQFQNLKKHSLPTVTFLKVSHSLQKFLLWFICFFQLKWFCKTVLIISVVELLCFNLFFCVIFTTKFYNISAIIWLPIVLYFFLYFVNSTIYWKVKIFFAM